jgi:ribosomal protein S14
LSNTSTDPTTASTGWRSTLSVHPAAELFPRMTPEELRALGEDVIKNGLTSPIVLWQPDSKSPARLLDGISRLDAIEIATGSPVIVGAPSIMAGQHFLDCDKVIVLDKSIDPYAYVISANIHRRHLTAEQKRELIAKLIKATPEKSDRQIAETVKASPTTVGTVRAEMETKGDVSKLDTRRDSKGRKQPAKKPPRAAANATGAEKTSNKNNGAKPSGAANTAPASPTTPARNEIGSASTSEARARNEERENEKRRLEIENTGLRSEIEEVKAAAKPAPKTKTASRCSICHEKNRAVLRPVFICDNCVDIYEVREAAPLPDDGLDIPECLRRSAS